MIAMADKTVLVTGATGTVSTALLAALKREPGLRLRALVHDPAKGQALQNDGVEVVTGDLDEPGTLYMNLGQGRLGTMDGRDVGVFAAKVIEDPDRHAGKVYNPTGPESIDMAEAAETLSHVLGKPVQYVPLPPDAAQQAMLGFGL